MKSAALTILILSLAKEALAFSALPSSSSSLRATAASSPLFAAAQNEDDSTSAALSRRDLLTQTITFTAAATLFSSPLTASAEDDIKSPTVVVAGATGQTGRRVLERLASQPNTSVIAAVRNVDKATKSLSESSTVVRGAMIQKVPSLNAAGIELRKLDVASDSTADITSVLSGAVSSSSFYYSPH